LVDWQSIGISTSPNFTIFLYMLPVAVTWSSSNSNEIPHVFPVLWIMSRFFHK